MAQIFIVTSGSYSDYSIEAVFSNKEVAKKYASLKTNHWNTARVEEYTVDEITIEDIQKEAVSLMDSKQLGYSFTFERNGALRDKTDLQYIRTPRHSDSIKGSKYFMSDTTYDKFFEIDIPIKVIYVNEEDIKAEYERCLKVAKDERAKYFAALYGL